MSCASAEVVGSGEGSRSAGDRWPLVGNRTGLASEVATMKSLEAYAVSTGRV